MPKSENQKLKLLYLKQFFEEESDENIAITVDDMRNYLAHCHIEAERKSLYEDVAALQEFGLDIEHPARSKSYKLMSRDFTVGDVKLMVDSILVSKSLSEKRSLELIKKLETLCSKHEAKNIHRQVLVANRAKTMNDTVHYHIDTIHKAISEDKQIHFLYFTYDTEKKRKYNKNKEFYIVSPFALIYADDNYYLLAFDSDAKKFKHYRVDRMESVDSIDTERVGKEEFTKIDLTAYTKYTFSMFGGEIEDVTMIFSNHLMNAVIDRFGKEVWTSKVDDRHFKITVPVAVSNQFFGWIFGLGKGVRIVSTESVRQQMKEEIEKIYAQYE